jgi:hypothetical protein
MAVVLIGGDYWKKMYIGRYYVLREEKYVRILEAKRKGKARVRVEQMCSEQSRNKTRRVHTEEKK